VSQSNPLFKCLFCKIRKTTLFFMIKIQEYKANQLCEGFVLKCGVWFLMHWAPATKADSDFSVCVCGQHIVFNLTLIL